MLTLTDLYDSGHDPITETLPPMVPGFRLLDRDEIPSAPCPPDIDPAAWHALIYSTPPACMDKSAAGRRHL